VGVLKVLSERMKQGHRTMKYPAGPAPELPPRFAGRPIVDASKCDGKCRKCSAVCPTDAISVGAGQIGPRLDIGRCIFCRECEKQCPSGAFSFTKEFRMSAAKREDLVVGSVASTMPLTLTRSIPKAFSRSLKLRQVSAGGCNACEADTNVLGTLAWDLGRFGVQFVASPRHADGIFVTGPVTENMKSALLKTYDAVASPKIVIAVGACAIAGGPYINHPEVHNGASSVVSVDLFIPGCPPHPLTILDGILSFLAAIGKSGTP
jgi:Ni,Fe-hydrogenase III small subunit/NAD-dependent dihydropyrimidine dehydrogenase PreA subunit